MQLPRLVPRLAHAVALRAGRRGARRGVGGPGRRQELASLQAARLRPADRAGRLRGAGSPRRSTRSSRSSSPRARPRTVRPSTAAMDKIRGIVDEELQKLQSAPPTRASSSARSTRSKRRSTAAWSASAGSAASAISSTPTYAATGNPDYFNEDLSRYRALAASDIQAAAAFSLPLDRRVELIVEPVEMTGRTLSRQPRRRRSSRARQPSPPTRSRRPTGRSRRPSVRRLRCTSRDRQAHAVERSAGVDRADSQGAAGSHSAGHQGGRRRDPAGSSVWRA